MRRGPSSKRDPEGPDAAGATGLPQPHRTSGPAAGRSFVVVELPNTVATVTNRLLLGVVVLLAAGCGGSSSDGRIDAGNAQDLVASRTGDVGVGSRAHVANGRLELVAPSGKLEVAAVPGTVRLLDAKTGATLDTLASRISRPSAIAWAQDSRTFAVGGADGRLTVWEEFRHRTYDLPVAAPVTGLAFSPDATLLAEADTGTGVRIWDTASRKGVARFGSVLGRGYVVTRMRFDNDGRRLVLAGSGTSGWQLTLPR
jgi:WD40 repeat protein